MGAHAGGDAIPPGQPHPPSSLDTLPYDASQQAAQLQGALSSLQQLQAPNGDPWHSNGGDPWGGSRHKRPSVSQEGPTPDPCVKTSVLNQGLDALADRLSAATTARMAESMAQFNADCSESIQTLAREA